MTRAYDSDLRKYVLFERKRGRVREEKERFEKDRISISRGRNRKLE